MKNKAIFAEILMAFCACTTCITILQGVMGMLFFPEEQLSYKAFFSPPLCGAISVLLGAVTWSKKELSFRQVLFRRALHLLLIEGMVFGLNYAAGIAYPTVVKVVLALGTAVVFVMVYVILWFIDQKSAKLFNQRLKEYQSANT